MKKKIITVLGIAVLAIAMGTTALATTVLDQPQKSTAIAQTQQNCGFGRGGGMMSRNYGLMMDENGKLLDKEAFEAKLDAAIKDGTIKPEDKEFYIERYEACTANGGMMLGRKGRRCGR